MIERLRRLSLCAALCGFLGLAATAVYAQTATYQFDLPAQPLADALRAVGRQTSTNVLFDPALVEGISVPALRAELTVSDAVKQLLAGTKLSTQEIASDTVLIRNGTRDAAKKPAASKTTAVQGTNGDMHLAQADNSQGSTSSDSKSGFEGTSEKSRFDGQELPAPEEIGVAIPEILVLGSKSLNTDIKRTRDDTQPYVVFEGDEIRRTQALTLESFFKTRLTMNTVQQSTSQTTLGASNNSAINLRGLGPAQTLILLNGRRLPSLLSGSAFNQPDINAIPTGAVERIEVLPATASGIHGGGATGGVVNIVTRRDIDGLEFAASYDNTFRWDMSNRRLSFAGGMDLEDNRTHLLLSGSHSDAGMLLYADRPFTYDGRLLRNANNPVGNLTSPILSYTTNICTAASPTATSCSATPLALTSGTVLSSNHTFVPVGYAGSSADAGAAFAANSGQYNLNLPNDLNGARRSVLNSPTLDSAFAGLRRDFTSNLEAFIDLSWYRNKGQTASASLPTTATIAATAPGNPFTSAVLVSFPSPSLYYTVDNETESSLAIGGVILRLPRGWTAETDYVWGRGRVRSFQTFPALNAAFNSAVASGTVNVLRDLNAFPLDYSPYLLPSPNTIIRPTRLILRDISLRASGPALDLPAGALTLTALLEHRDEDGSDVLQDNMSAAGVASQFFFPARSQEADSLYLEARAPLISRAAHARPFLRELELQASVRRDEYRTDAPTPSLLSGPPFASFVDRTNRAESTDYTVGLRYAPFDVLTLRASYGTGFLPPSVGQISPAAPFTQTAVGAAALRDPKRGGALGSVVPYTVFSGGNPGLTPEESESLSVGATLTLPAVPGFRLSVDFVRIEKSDEIRTLTAQQILDLENFFPSRVTRAALTPADSALGFTGGLITAIDNSMINAATTDVEAYDVQADYSFKTARFGDFHLHAIGTRQPVFTVTPGLLIPSFDTVGFDSGVLEWRANVGVTWNYAAWTLGWDAQYLDSYKPFTATANAATRTATVLDQGSDTIPSQTYHDFSLAYRFDKPSGMAGLLADTEILFGVQNVFDKRPPIIAVTSPTFGGYSTHADPRLRRFTLTARKRF